MRSSVDPHKTSMTVKYALIGIIPYVMQASDMVCEFGYTCMNFSDSFLNQMVDAITLSIFGGLTVISATGAIYGLMRKVVNTWNGTNKALQ